MNISQRRYQIYSQNAHFAAGITENNMLAMVRIVFSLINTDPMLTFPVQHIPSDLRGDDSLSSLSISFIRTVRMEFAK